MQALLEDLQGFGVFPPHPVLFGQDDAQLRVFSLGLYCGDQRSDLIATVNTLTDSNKLRSKLRQPLG